MESTMHISDIEYEDFEWFAVDALDELAMFTNAGTSSFPECLSSRLNDLYGFFSAIQGFELVSDVTIIISNDEGRKRNDWTSISRRGIFGYDCNIRNGKRYEQICAPVSPVKFTSVKASLEGIGIFIASFDGIFQEARIIERDLILQMPFYDGSK